MEEFVMAMYHDIKPLVVEKRLDERFKGRVMTIKSYEEQRLDTDPPASEIFKDKSELSRSEYLKAISRAISAATPALTDDELQEKFGSGSDVAARYKRIRDLLGTDQSKMVTRQVYEENRSQEDPTTPVVFGQEAELTRGAFNLSFLRTIDTASARADAAATKAVWSNFADQLPDSEAKDALKSALRDNPDPDNE